MPVSIHDRDHRALAPDPAAHEQGRERRRQGHREDRREPDGADLGRRERAEQPALAAVQREHRQEREGGDQQREEQRPGDLLHRCDHRRQACAPGEIAPGEPLVDVLDHHDRGVDHRADRDDDAAERHDVDGEPGAVERHEREQDRDRQGQDRHERAAHVEQEEEDDEADDDHLLDQRPAQRADRTADQVRAVVGHDEVDVLG
ncbi:MAG TPA: hypothetical protein VLM79_24030 [Kofleriaceae bacterium]|nr:hypothetical protein [Kofleriaceae bacterium]